MIVIAYLVFAALIGVLVLHGRSWGLYWHWRRSAWRTMALAVGVFMVVVSGWFVVHSGLSKPLPVDRVLFQDREKSGELLWFGEQPPDVFHLLIRWPGAYEPRFYTLPWSDELAAQLDGAMQGLAEGESIGISPFRIDGYDLNADLPRVFHPLPQPADPLKEDPIPDQPQEGA